LSSWRWFIILNQSALFKKSKRFFLKYQVLPQFPSAPSSNWLNIFRMREVEASYQDVSSSCSLNSHQIDFLMTKPTKIYGKLFRITFSHFFSLSCLVVNINIAKFLNRFKQVPEALPVYKLFCIYLKWKFQLKSISWGQ